MQLTSAFGGANAANEGYAVGAELGYKVWKGRAYGRVSYQDFKVATVNITLVESITRLLQQQDTSLKLLGH